MAATHECAGGTGRSLKIDSSSNEPGGATRHSRGVPLYIGAGGVATATHYAVTVACVELAGLSPVLASTIGFAFGAAIKYWLNYAMTFRSQARHSHAVLRFATMLAVLWGLNAALMGGLTYGLGLHYMVAQVLTTGLLIPPGYLMSRNWVFA